MAKIEMLKALFSRDKLRTFFMGKIYPLVVALIVTVGYFTGLEFYLHFVNMALVCAALLVCDSLRPVIMPLCSFVFQISMENTPADFNPNGTQNYYFEGARLPLLVISFVCVFSALVYFFIKNKAITKKSLLSLPYLVPTAVLSLAFLAGGAFSGEWTGGELGFSLVQIVCWFVIFYILVLGLKNEGAKELTEYLVYVSSLIAIILIAEVLEIYITTEDMMSESGEYINRAFLRYGWGVCNNAAQAIGVFVPVMFIGAVKNERLGYRIYYFAIATLAFFGSIMNASRTALVIGVPMYIVCLVIFVIKSKQKLLCLFEIFTVASIMAVLFVPIFTEIELLVANYLTRGMDDSGRYDIWRHGVEMFKAHPIFGLGAFGLSESLGYNNYVSFIPYMMHNTFVQMLGAYGAFGFAAYIFYRVSFATAFFRKPTFEKSMMGLALLSVLVGSMLDNFVFQILPMLYFSTCFAVVNKHVEEQKSGGCVSISQNKQSTDAPSVNDVEQRTVEDTEAEIREDLIF